MERWDSERKINDRFVEADEVSWASDKQTQRDIV